jgi:hypothetical protein
LSVPSPTSDTPMATSTKKAQGGITKQEAVRRALAELGHDAKPTQIQGWVKEKYAIEMGTDHISTAKGQILSEAGKRKPAAVAQPSAAQNSEPREQGRPTPRGNAIGLDDIEAVKGLVGRVGADSLKKLVDLLAR